MAKILHFFVVFLKNVNFNRESKRANFPSGGGGVGARMNKKTGTQGKLEKLGFLNGIFWCFAPYQYSV
jgi:hypothetical protein